MLVQAGRAKTGMGDFYFVMYFEYVLPCEYVRDTKDDHTGDDVEEITEGQGTHQLVEIVFLFLEPDDQTKVADNAQDSNKDLRYQP